jgi:hypothetical protein
MNPSDLAKLLARKDELESLLGGFEIWLLIFGLLVVTGVAGESFFGIRTWWNNRKLQEVNRQIDQYRQSETAQVNQRAGEALERAAKAEENLAGANERAAKAEQAAAEANRAAEQERLARVRIEERLAPRVLSPQQQQILVQRLRPLAERTIDIFIYGDTPEIVGVATVLTSLLRSAGCNTQFWTVLGGGAVTGILVLTRSGSDSATENAASGLISALNSVGIAAGPWQSFTDKDTPGLMNGPPWDNAKMASIRLLIGTKP